jgi:acetyl esterase/lipase
MKIYLVLISLIVCPLFISAQNFTLSLWEGTVPNYKETDEKEAFFTDKGIYFINNIQKPDITVYLPSKGLETGETVIICPGGGYWNLAYYWEGRDIARALNAKGIAAIVLKYRLPTSNNYIVRHKSPLLDAQRAMRMVRYHAKEWNINPNKIGVMGFSAGGHLASTLSTHYDKGNPQAKDSIEQYSSRPNFSILVYPVVTMSKSYGHKGSTEALLGKNPSQELLNNFSNELQITKDTPPTFLVHSSDDNVVPVKNSLIYYEALQKNNIPAEMHIYPYGGHGYSLAIGKGHLASWIDRCTDWIHYTNKSSKKTEEVKEK